MRYFFSESGLQRLDQMIVPRLLCVFDFDGTLAPIVARPEQAGLSAEIRAQMVLLSEVATIAILTGRSLDDIGARLGFAPHYTLGNHGIEGVPGWDNRSKSYVRLCRHWAQEIDAALRGWGDGDAGIELENKRLSLAVHYRQARDPQASAQRLLALFERLQPAPRVLAGKCVFNLLPHGAADKGSALVQLMQVTGAQGAVYVGDDVTDEDVFRLDRPDILGIRTEYEAYSAAEFFLTNRLEMPRLLDELTCRMAECSLS